MLFPLPTKVCRVLDLHHCGQVSESDLSVLSDWLDRLVASLEPESDHFISVEEEKFFEGIERALAHFRGLLEKEDWDQVRQLNEIAESRGQSLAQMAIVWLLKDERISTVLVGASKTSQIIDNVKALDNLSFSEEELTKIEGILGG